MASKSATQAHFGSEEVRSSLYRIAPFNYIHVLDLNKNVTRLEIGPNTFVPRDHELVVFGPDKMLTVPPRHYCVIENPLVRTKDGEVVKDSSGQAKLWHADQEIRLAQDPFPLWPGEVLKQPVTPLKVVIANTALHLSATRDFVDDAGEQRTAGDEWLFEGPGTYTPRKEVTADRLCQATIIRPNNALKLRARRDCVDRGGQTRVTGEEWLVKQMGAYLPGVYEEIVDMVAGYVLTETKALHMRALRTFNDDFGVVRKHGEEWLVKLEDTELHIPNVYEEVVDVKDITTLTNRQYCVVLDPVDEQNHPQLGSKKLVKGERSFFLMPGERLEKDIQDIYVLGEDEGLILRATESFKDGTQERQPGDRWHVRGPVEYVPPVEVEVVTKRVALPLDETEGIYVRNIKTGRVRVVTGETYMLNQDEELWEKHLPCGVEWLLARVNDPPEQAQPGQRTDRSAAPPPVLHKADTSCFRRDETRVVTYRVPHNAAVQIYDYTRKKARVIFGPELVMLGPDEQFTKLSLSGGKPKDNHVFQTLHLLLGPDFFTDIIEVETSDHARLRLQVSYNWHFEVKDHNDEAEAAKVFNVPDFIGDACKAMAAKVRAAVAGVKFDNFHKNSSQIIRVSTFGYDGKKQAKERIHFPQNNLVITSIDIQNVEPVDQKTKDSLQKSVQLAIEITTSSQEATARHEGERQEQVAKGHLERQMIDDASEAEKGRMVLLELQANSAAVESTGQAKAEAQSHAEAAKIQGEAAVERAKLTAEAMGIEAEAELNRMAQAREADIRFTKEKNEIAIKKLRDTSELGTEKFRKMVNSIGADTIRAIATSGPEMQVKLLQSLGLKSTLITDGTTPINLFNTAQGLIGASQ